MFQFISKLDNVTLSNNYLACYNTDTLNSSFLSVLSKNKELKKILPRGYKTASKILVAPFSILSDIYFSYISFVSSLPATKKNTLNKELSVVFNYDANVTPIANFLMDPTNQFEICNCVYCDLKRVRGYYDTQGHRQRREFQTDHVLDKGKCPIIGLSLFNFVPACPDCNSRAHKGTKSLGDNKMEAMYLSPTSELNLFCEEVNFTLNVLNPHILDLKFFEKDEDVEIDFKGATKKYSKTLSIFRLKDRYNSYKQELIEPIFSMRKYPPTKIQNIAKILEVSEEEIFEDKFQFRKRESNKSPMEKCRRDLFTEIYGSVDWSHIKG